ncbi:hypothetical protein [Falsirhodobacter sp. alg1]|uniref:hypothetical protein n=1 Tax=Falsirhodobacter sp. alg1 TaxID=1472418 RepID=UPI0005EE140A|nr:hypothetical protein [Falsirhodobacter sp. alg1]
MPTELNADEIDALIARAGLSPDASLREALHRAWPYVAEMAERVRTPRGRAAEPAHIFALLLPEGSK